MIVRRELPVDADAVAAVHAAAFPGDPPVEVALVARLRSDPWWLPGLSLIAIHDGTVAGHVCLTRATVDATPVAALGPIGVLPDRQRAGVGSALIHAVLGAADALGEPLVGLVGDPDYYARFGFVAADSLGVAPDQADWASHFQVRPLTTWTPALTGTFRYAEPFYAL
ncbi:MAG TPA: N-acetyltransferase [Aldersonia sp.]